MSDNTGSKFKSFMDETRKRVDQPQGPASVPYNDRPQQSAGGAVSPQPAQESPHVTQQPAKRGRPAGGKRNNPNYEQVAAYIPKDLYRQVQIRLLQMEPKGQFSDLVEFLLNKWIQQPPRQ